MMNSEANHNYGDYVNEHNFSNAQNKEKKERLEHENKVQISEQAIIGALLNSAVNNKTLMNEIFENIKPEDFIIEFHRTLFNTMFDIYKEGNRPDPSLVIQKSNIKGINDAEYTSYILSISNMATQQIDENYSEHLKIIRNFGSLKELNKISDEIGKMSRTNKSFEQTYDVAINSIKAIPRNVENKTIHSKEHLTGFIDLIDKRFNGTNKSLWQTGFTDLDEVMNIEEGDMLVLAGRPSMGKTTIGLNMVTNWLKNELPTLVISLEMSSDQLLENLVASIGGVDVTRLKKGTIQQEDWQGINHAINFLYEKPLYINSETNFTASKLRTTIENAVNEHGIKCVMIDYIQLIDSEKGSFNRVEEVSKISRAIKLLAKEFGIAILTLSQLSRGVDARPDKRPIMSDLRDSGAIEQDADKIVFLYRDEIYNPDTNDKGIAEVIGVKNRGGAIFNIRLLTELHQGRFKNFTFLNQEDRAY